MSSITEAKKYLSKAYKINQLIESDKAEIVNLRSLAVSLRAVDSTKEKVKSSSSGDAGYTNIVLKISDLEEKIQNEISQLVSLLNEIRDVILTVDDRDELLVLKYRYLMFWDWEHIARKLCTGERNIYRIHDNALKNIKIP